jgi:hypothetical protein
MLKKHQEISELNRKVEEQHEQEVQEVIMQEAKKQLWDMLLTAPCYKTQPIKMFKSVIKFN